ncbi:hypothetical protein AHAS_Ahas17G0092000 [Arachis hypogaea]
MESLIATLRNYPFCANHHPLLSKAPRCLWLPVYHYTTAKLGKPTCVLPSSSFHGRSELLDVPTVTGHLIAITGTSEFIQHFNRCVDHIRWKEVQADLASVNGRPSMQTCFQQLERSAANVYTLSVFYMFQPILVRAVSTKVINMRQTGSYVIYSVGLDRTPNEIWRVFCCDIEMEFKCSCLRMESFGIPCEHILCVLVHEDIKELPRSLVLPRWTKTAKVDLQNSEEDAAQKELVNDADSCGMEGHNQTTCRVHQGISHLEGRGNDTFDNDLDDHMNIENDLLVYDESSSYSSNEVL